LTILTVSAQLTRDLEHQDKTFASAFSILRESIAQHAFPAASIAVTHQGRLIALRALGRFTYEADASSVSGLREDGSLDLEVTSATLFDLASLTKPIATTTMAAMLYERGLMELDSPVVGILPEFLADDCHELDPRRHEVTFRMLLAHSSGLPAYEKLFLSAHSRNELLLAALTTALSADPGTRVEYSDIGFIVLGAALERIAEEPLEAFCQREIFGPLAMTHTTFNPPADLRQLIPPAADERDSSRDACGAGAPARETPEASAHSNKRSTFRHKIIQGEVQDENASIMGGVAGHAGLFSTAEDLAIFAHAMLQCGAGTAAREMPAPISKQSASDTTVHPILRPETVALFTRREPAPPATSRALGWDTPSAPSQSGKYFGPNSYGHLGYTGTSLWIDPDRELSITLLTNRTWPDCSNQAIKQIRPRFHDAIVEALQKS
jgi:CubicO group peptidase (beta-lactamase class C family)